MTITDIIPKRKRLSAVYIDGEYALMLDTEALISSRFSVGSEISYDELKALIEASGEKRAKEKALRLIARRDHSRRELEEKIRRNSDADSARKAVERMEELGLVNDEKFARRYADELINIKHYSAKGAVFKLTEKGIGRELAELVLDELDPDPREHIGVLIEKKYKSLLNDEKGRRRTFAALQRLGYSYGDINAVINEYSGIEEEYI